MDDLMRLAILTLYDHSKLLHCHLVNLYADRYLRLSESDQLECDSLLSVAARIADEMNRLTDGQIKLTIQEAGSESFEYKDRESVSPSELQDFIRKAKAFEKPDAG